MNPSVLNHKVYISKLKKGFTLAETVASMIALAVVSMSAQSIIMLSNKFSSKVDRTLSALEHQNTFHNLVCSSMAYPVAVQTDQSKTFYWDKSNSKYIRMSANPPSPTQHATLAYHKHGATSITTENPNIPDVDLYKIYADSHTLITYTPSGNIIDTSKFQMGDIKENSGMIVATRCVTNSATFGDAIIDSTQDTHDLLTLILDNSNRPFFFKDETKAVDQVRCCNISSISGTPGSVVASSCANLNTQTPVTYVIKFKSMGTVDIKKSDGSDGSDGIADIFQGLSTSNADSSNNTFTFSDEDGHSITRTTDNSLKAFCQNNTFAKATYDAKLSEHSGEPDAVDEAEQACLEQHYYPTVLQEFSIPISSSVQVATLPIIKRLAQELWSTTFIASAFNNQASSFNLKLIDVQNTCHTSGLKHCATFPPNKPLDYSISGEVDDTDPINPIQKGTLMSDLLDVHSKNCHFRYAKQEDTSSYVPMGLVHGAAQ